MVRPKSWSAARLVSINVLQKNGPDQHSPKSYLIRSKLLFGFASAAVFRDAVQLLPDLASVAVIIDLVQLLTYCINCHDRRSLFMQPLSDPAFTTVV